jgi:hypothetical protein
MKSAVAAMILLGCALGCSSSTQPPEVASAPGGFGGSTPYPSPCPSSSSNGDAGNFDFEAGFDAGLGIGTTNPTTPAEGGTAFSGDATVAPAGDSGTPCR